MLQIDSNFTVVRSNSLVQICRADKTDFFYGILSKSHNIINLKFNSSFPPPPPPPPPRIFRKLIKNDYNSMLLWFLKTWLASQFLKVIVKVLLLVKFDIMLGRHNCLTESCCFVMIM